MLSQKQKAFARYLFQGMTNYDAYEKAGYAITVRETVNANASRLAHSDSVRAYLDELNTPVEAKAIATVIQRKERLTQIAMEDIQTNYGINRQPCISAITELNKMDKLYAPEIDQRVINITVISEEGKKNIERVLKGEGT